MEGVCPGLANAYATEQPQQDDRRPKLPWRLLKRMNPFQKKNEVVPVGDRAKTPAARVEKRRHVQRESSTEGIDSVSDDQIEETCASELLDVMRLLIASADAGLALHFVDYLRASDIQKVYLPYSREHFRSQVSEFVRMYVDQITEDVAFQLLVTESACGRKPSSRRTSLTSVRTTQSLPLKACRPDSSPRLLIPPQVPSTAADDSVSTNASPSASPRASPRRRRSTPLPSVSSVDSGSVAICLTPTESVEVQAKRRAHALASRTSRASQSASRSASVGDDAEASVRDPRSFCSVVSDGVEGTTSCTSARSSFESAPTRGQSTRRLADKRGPSRKPSLTLTWTHPEERDPSPDGPRHADGTSSRTPRTHGLRKFSSRTSDQSGLTHLEDQLLQYNTDRVLEMVKYLRPQGR